MFPLLDCSPGKITELASEVGASLSYGQLQTPLTRYANHQGIWAGDNGGFSRQDPAAFNRALNHWIQFRDKCLWISVTDVVGSARRTLELFVVWGYKIKTTGFPVALVAQDGIENMEVPWDDIDAIFIGGTTEWKMSEHAANMIRTAKWLGKKTHAGRVNTVGRFKHFQDLGVDTYDGSGLARPFPGARQRRAEIADYLATGKCPCSPVQDADSSIFQTELAETAGPESAFC